MMIKWNTIEPEVYMEVVSFPVHDGKRYKGKKL